MILSISFPQAFCLQQIPPYTLPVQDAAPKSGNDIVERPQDTQKEEMEELKRIVDGLWEDYKMQLEIKKKHQEIENGLKLKIEALFEKRDALRKERVRNHNS